MTQSSTGSANIVAGRSISLLLGAIGAFLFLAGCTPPPDEGVLAFVNGRQITQTEFDTRWGELAEATRARYQKEGGKRLFLDELITRELLMQEARKLGLDQSETIRDRTQRYREQLILDELLKDRIKAKVELSNEELEAYYEQHTNELLTPLKVRVSLMLLPNISAAKDLEKQVNQGGHFAQFAQRYSIDGKSKANGGDLGPYRKGLVAPEVDAVIHTLKPGFISAPIKTDAGYYLVMITPLDKEIIQADVAVRERLRQELLNEKRRKRFDGVIADIRAKAVIRLADASRYVTDDVGPTESSRIQIALSQTPQVLCDSCTILCNLAGRSISSAPVEPFIHDHDPSVFHNGTRLA